MIEINLLPEVMRKKEGTPMPQMLGLIVALVLVAGMAYAVAMYITRIIPGLENDKRILQNKERELKLKEAELREINQTIARLSGHVDTVKDLYRRRIVWAKILSDIKNIVNFDPNMSNYNMDMRYIWLDKLSGKGAKIDLTGFATAGNQVSAMQMPEHLLANIQSFTPTRFPEKEEEARLQGQLKDAIAKNEALRRENPTAPVQSEEEIKIRERLSEIKNIKSGGIALQPFNKLLKPKSLSLNSATWTSAPQPKTDRTKENESIVLAFPKQAWQFNISMELGEPNAVGK